MWFFRLCSGRQNRRSKLHLLGPSERECKWTPFPQVERYTAIRTIAAEMIAQGTGAEMGLVLGLLASDAGYATPKVDVRGVVFRDGKILLVQERSDGLWTLPGGWAEVGDSPGDAVVREVREESGYRSG
jgi:hypothetical protein